MACSVTLLSVLFLLLYNMEVSVCLWGAKDGRYTPLCMVLPGTSVTNAFLHGILMTTVTVHEEKGGGRSFVCKGPNIYQTE